MLARRAEPRPEQRFRSGASQCTRRCEVGDLLTSTVVFHFGGADTWRFARPGDRSCAHSGSRKT
jgi:hypothetical protein